MFADGEIKYLINKMELSGKFLKNTKDEIEEPW
jgi:hypothetical protein